LAERCYAILARISFDARSPDFEQVAFEYMSSLMRLAKFLYLLFFPALASRVLRRGKRMGAGHNEERLSSFKVVCHYGFQGGITNGAINNSLALESLGHTVQKVDVTSAIKNPLKLIACSVDGTFIFHCAAPEFVLLAWPLRRVFRSGKVIGYFAWELAAPPRNWPRYEDLWDEIWTPSSFSARSLGKYYSCPIRVVPHVVLKQGKPRSWAKGAEPLRFLTMADGRSSLARKNPHATVAAFRKAFPDERDVALIVKLQAKQMTTEMERLLVEIGDDPRIRVIKSTLRRSDVDQLFTDAHVYVSLHRAEGFGLPLLEARTFGLATIATAWSGNLDFMTEEDSVLVPYRLATTLDEGGVYGQVTWAEPDVDAAAFAMRRLYESPTHLADIAKAGWEASRPERQMAGFASAIKSGIH
jgi:glycosyltransferase involved in cell wall biosynthesis